MIRVNNTQDLLRAVDRPHLCSSNQIGVYLLTSHVIHSLFLCFGTDHAFGLWGHWFGFKRVDHAGLNQNA